MSSDSLLEQIAAPIPGENPAGVDTRVDRSFNRIKDARNEASRIEKRAKEDVGDPTKTQKDVVTRGSALPHWKTVADLGQQALAARTKDLDIASYVIEAAARLDGFAGLAEAFRWTRGMVENCWDHIYPIPDADDGEEITPESVIEDRIQPLSRLSGGEGDGLLLEPLSWLEITGGGDAEYYCFWQYRQALEYAKASDSEKEIRQKRGTVTSAQFDQAAKQTPDDHYRTLIQAMVDCKAEYTNLISVVDVKIKASGLENAPQVSWTRLHEELEKCLATVRHITQGRFPEPTAAAAEAVEETKVEAGDNGASPTPGIDNVMRTREDAFRALLAIADYFERSEPQSLIPAQLKKVIRLGRLSPVEYFTEILENSDVREQLFKVYGLGNKE